MIRASERHLPADARRGSWPSPGCRVLRNTDWRVLAGGPPTERTCTPPSPAKAMRYRMRAELRALAWDCVVPACVAVPVAVAWWVYLCTHH